MKAAYKLGLQDGKNQYQRTLTCIEKTMGNLFKQLRIMDLREPDMVNRVYFSRKFLKRLKNGLRTHYMNSLYIFVLKEEKRQLGKTLDAEAKLRELLSELEE